MAAPGAIARLLALPDYRRLWLVGGLGNTMRWLELLAATLWTFEATGSALTVALVATMRSLPMLLLGALAGALADRLDRRALLLGLQACSGLGAALVALLALLGVLQPWHLMAQGLLAGLAWAGEMSVRRRMVAEAAPAEELVPAVALDTMTGSTTRCLGPLLGGLLFQLLGLALAAALAAAVHLLCLLLVLRVPRRPRPVLAPEAGPLAGMAEALRHAWGEPRLRLVLGVTLVMNVFAYSHVAVLPSFGWVAFGAAGAMVGLLAAAEPLGALLGGWRLTLARPAAPAVGTLLAGSFAFLLALLAAAASPAYALAFAALALGGLGTARFAAMQTALVMTAAPEAIRSRVLGLVTTCIGAGPLGALLAGALADAFGPRAALLAMAGAGLALLGALLAAERALARPRDGR